MPERSEMIRQEKTATASRTGDWKPCQNDRERIKKGVAMMRQALAEATRREAERPLSLPKYWRGRIFD